MFGGAQVERGAGGGDHGDAFLKLARETFNKAPAMDSENLTSHYNISLLYGQLGDATKAEYHRTLHEKYRPDDNARDRAVTIARLNNPAANHAAQATVIYPLQRQGAFGLSPQTSPKQAAR